MDACLNTKTAVGTAEVTQDIATFAAAVVLQLHLKVAQCGDLLAGHQRQAHAMQYHMPRSVDPAQHQVQHMLTKVHMNVRSQKLLQVLQNKGAIEGEMHSSRSFHTHHQGNGIQLFALGSLLQQDVYLTLQR